MTFLDVVGYDYDIEAHEGLSLSLEEMESKMNLKWWQMFEEDEDSEAFDEYCNSMCGKVFTYTLN